jgi:hypothetical protein
MRRLLIVFVASSLALLAPAPARASWLSEALHHLVDRNYGGAYPYPVPAYAYPPAYTYLSVPQNLYPPAATYTYPPAPVYPYPSAPAYDYYSVPEYSAVPSYSYTIEPSYRYEAHPWYAPGYRYTYRPGPYRVFRGPAGWYGRHRWDEHPEHWHHHH